jgi:sulfite reductase (NADPH) flavoprotein alpha-component
MVANGRSVYQQLQAGARVYVCGDGAHMVRGVEAALVDIIAEQGGVDRESAKQELRLLQAKGRFLADTWC